MSSPTASRTARQISTSSLGKPGCWRTDSRVWGFRKMLAWILKAR